MNCKPGDMAICVEGRHKGRIGTVVELFAGGKCGGVDFFNIPAGLGPIWVFEAPGGFTLDGKTITEGPFPDAWLRPIAGPLPSDAAARQAMLDCIERAKQPMEVES
ncbi:KOW motif-containing protein [Massilia sp. CCM 8734]|uniref:KOW motif-containing protein n=1 Tax=Massilia sp. CCM 8734 TaxID=2609283 RepID=UPI0014225672|nr:KOW motif-containing protein [Massilia sp. CCM 8734]NHZ94583.1 hypothetical protein [Massilia sp. CCM 8734]